MKRILTITMLFFTVSTFAQRTAQISFSTGVTNYIGDLGNEKYFPYSSANMGTAITLRDFINDPKRSGTKFAVVDMQLRFSWHRLQYDEVSPIGDKQGTDLRNYRRGIGFRNDLFGLETDFTYNFFLNRYAPLSKVKYCLFLSAGIGAFYGQPTADLFNGSPDIANRYYNWSDGSIHNVAENSKDQGEMMEKDGKYETNLRDWLTEGQGYNAENNSKKTYSTLNVGMPVGGGFRYICNKYLTLSAEFNYYFFLTDYLDDVSDRYATYDELRSTFTDKEQYEMAKYISDPSGKGTTGVSTYASRRGNVNTNDAFTFVSIDVAYKFVWKKKGIYGQTR
jgi:hypothetical protein